MSAESDVYAALSGFSGLTTIVGTAIYPDVLPEKTPYPAVVFARVRTEPVISISNVYFCLLYTSPSPRDRTRSRMPSSA